MEVEHPIAVSILASYFVLIFALVWRIRTELSITLSNASSKVYVFIFLAVISFLATWTYMFKFFIFSYNEWKINTLSSEPLSLNTISLWLKNTSLFDSAWRQVSLGVWQWLWSHQLCSLTVTVWTPILAIEGTRRKIPYVWVYMLLGQVVAISVAASLFFATILVYKPIVNREPSNGLIKSLFFSTVGGAATVILSPFVASTSAFLPNLLVMHILLIFPLVHLQNTSASKNKTIIYHIILYTLAAGSNFSIYVNQWFRCIDSLLVANSSRQHLLHDIYSMIVDTFFHHPAQSSISSDIVCMQFISMAWMWTYSRSEFKGLPIWVLALIGLTPILSASVTLPVFLGCCEYKKLLIEDSIKNK